MRVLLADDSDLILERLKEKGIVSESIKENTR
jgi:broad-specificity NMP kinase